MEWGELRRRSLMETRNKPGLRISRAQSTDNLDTGGERAANAPGIKGRNSKRGSVVRGHFPKLADCAHFHYEFVDFRGVQLSLVSQEVDIRWDGVTTKDAVFLIKVTCQGQSWLVRRSCDDWVALDTRLHQCIYDRRYSQLPPPPQRGGDRTELLLLLSGYLDRLSAIADNKINCGPVLTWIEIDNKGNRLLLTEETSINVPAIAAATAIKRYTAQAPDEISLEVGDIVSVIDMPPEEETSWWKGKQGYQVGLFPSECVQIINERLTQSGSVTASKPESDRVGARVNALASTTSPSSVSRKHGKLLGFLRTFMKSRPSRQKLKQRGILRERVFGADLGEYLLDSGLDVPQVLKSCSEFIETFGIVDGIYRLSGISSNIQKLRHEFDSERVPDLRRDVYMQDIHCVSSLCKLYFRELPNPLLTYQLYDCFAEAVQAGSEEERLIKIHNVIQQLPPPNYRTLQYLVRHLSRLASLSCHTNMHTKNLAIVWAPNLLRSKDIEMVGFSGAAAFREVRVQSVLVEFLLSNVSRLFSDTFTSAGKGLGPPRASQRLSPRPRGGQRLLTIGEAMALTLPQPPGQGTQAAEEGVQANKEGVQANKEGVQAKKEETRANTDEIQAEEEIQANKEEIQANEEEIRANKEEIQANNEEIHANKEEIQANKGEIQANREDIQANKEEIQANKGEIHANKGEIQANKEEIQANEEEIHANSEEIQANTEEIQANREEIQAEEEMIQAEEETQEGEEVQANKGEIQANKEEIQAAEVVHVAGEETQAEIQAEEGEIQAEEEETEPRDDLRLRDNNNNNTSSEE